MVSETSAGVPAADKTLSVLETLASNPQGVSTAELLESVGGSRSGLYTLMNTLKARGYLVSDSGRHRLGPALWTLLPERPRELETLLGAFNEELESLEESVALTWPRPGGTVVVAERQPDRPVRAVYRQGATRPSVSPDARVLAAGGPAEDAETAMVRRNAAASESGPELHEVAVPICADGVRPIAALVVGVPAQRADTGAVADVERYVRRLAARLSYRLGAPSYQPYGWASADPVGPNRDLVRREIDEFMAGLWGAQLACVRSDGTPHVVPLWYEWDGESMWLAASPGASWRAHVEDNPRVSVTLDEPWPPLRRVFLTGVASEVRSSEVPGGLKGLRRRLAVRYLGRGAERQPELSEVEGWAAVRIDPERIHGMKGLGSLQQEAS